MDFSWKEIIIIVFGGGGAVAGLVALFKAISERYDIVKKERREQKQIHDSLALEEKKLALTEDERNRLEFEAILDNYKKRVDDLKTEIKDLKEKEKTHDSLSRPIITRLYSSIRQLRRQVDELDWSIEKQRDYAVLHKQITQIKENLDELEKQLP